MGLHRIETPHDHIEEAVSLRFFAGWQLAIPQGVIQLIEEGFKNVRLAVESFMQFDEAHAGARGDIGKRNSMPTTLSGQ